MDARKLNQTQFLENVGHKMKLIRDDIFGFTQKEMAWEINMSQSFISGLEKGKKHPEGFLFFILQSLGIDTSFFFSTVVSATLPLGKKPVTVGERFKLLREEMEKNEWDMAKILDIPTKDLAAIEMGKIKPTKGFLVGILHLFPEDEEWLKSGGRRLAKETQEEFLLAELEEKKQIIYKMGQNHRKLTIQFNNCRELIKAQQQTLDLQKADIERQKKERASLLKEKS